MPFKPRCLAVPCGLARSAWLFRSCRRSSPLQCVVRQYSTTRHLPIDDPLENSESQHIRKDASEKPGVEQEVAGSTEEAEGGKTQSPGKAQRTGKQLQSTWDPEIVVESSRLSNRPGLSRFMEFRELKEPPGLEFDTSTTSLSVSPSFKQNLHFHPPSHHRARPWIQKALMQRAVKWAQLEMVDKRRVDQPTRTLNRTARRHRGNTFAHLSLLHNSGSSIWKHAHEPSFVRWAKHMGPDLPERLHAHLDGIEPDDVHIFMEDHKSYVKGHAGRVVSCIWVAINASYSVSMRACHELARGNQPHPDSDVLTPVLNTFSKWLAKTYTDQKPKAQEYGMNDNRSSQQYIPLIRDMMPPDHDIPVVFAFRQTFLLFILKGGVGGKLVAQYQSHWLPVNDAWDFNVDNAVNQLQLARLRAGADENAKSKTSGGNHPPEEGGDPEWMDSSFFNASLLKGQEGEENPSPPKGKQKGPSSTRSSSAY